MNFDDEKDLIEGTDLKIDDDGTVEWDDILNSSDDDLVSIKDTQSTKSTSASVSDDDDDISDLILSDDTDGVEGEISDTELAKILQDDSRKFQDPTEQTFDSPDEILFDSQDPTEQTFETYQTQATQEDFDIDKQLNAAVLEDSNELGPTTPVFAKKSSKSKKKKSDNSLLLCVFLIFVLALGGGIYWFMNFQSNADLDSDILPTQQTKQDEMDKMGKNEMAQKSPENNSDIIPVVNEEQANEIKPEEQKIEEKKEVVNIVQTGRSNPFEPLSQYLPKETITKVPLVRYDKVSLIKPPTQYGILNEATKKMLTIAVSGIMYDNVNPSAIISYDNNDYFVHKGDMLDDYKVVGIGKNFVAISLGTNIYRASVGEEFKINNFTGLANYTRDGIRYPSVIEKNSDTIVRTDGSTGGFRGASDNAEADVQIIAK